MNSNGYTHTTIRYHYITNVHIIFEESINGDQINYCIHSTSLGIWWRKNGWRKKIKNNTVAILSII